MFCVYKILYYPNSWGFGPLESSGLIRVVKEQKTLRTHVTLTPILKVLRMFNYGLFHSVNAQIFVDVSVSDVLMCVYYLA